MTTGNLGADGTHEPGVPHGATHIARNWPVESHSDPGAIRFIDEALRTVAYRADQQDKPMPSLRAVRLAPRTLELILQEPTSMGCPAINSTPDNWNMEANAHLLGPPPGAEPPYPALTAIGLDSHGAHVLVNLDAVGLIEVAGQSTCPMFAIQAMTIELVSSPWSAKIPVHLVGFGQNLADALPGRVRYTRRTVDFLDELEAAPTPPMNTPEPPPRAEASKPDRVPSIIFCARLSRDEHGRLIRIIGARTDLTVVAVLPYEMEHHDITGWIIDTDTGRAQLCNTTLAMNLYGQTSEQFDDAVDYLAVQQLQLAEQLSGSLSVGQQPQFEAAREQFDGLEIRVLGDVEVLGATGELKDPGKRSRMCELIAYLACHPGARAETIMDAVWTEDASRATLNTAISRARTWLGVDKDGRSFLPEYTAENGYRLSPSVRLDWDEFQHHIHRAKAADESAGIYELTAALDLVRNVPFTGASAGHYEWAELFLVPTMISTITDTAHELARLLLNTGNAARAREAAATGLIVDPLSARMWCDMLAATSNNRRSVHTLIGRYQRKCAGLHIQPDAEVIALAKALLRRA